MYSHDSFITHTITAILPCWIRSNSHGALAKSSMESPFSEKLLSTDAWYPTDRTRGKVYELSHHETSPQRWSGDVQPLTAVFENLVLVVFFSLWLVSASDVSDKQSFSLSRVDTVQCGVLFTIPCTCFLSHPTCLPLARSLLISLPWMIPTSHMIAMGTCTW